MISWNEENRVKQIEDNGKTTYFLYDDAGERVVKRGQHGETIYVNRFYSIRNGELGTKSVFAGETRVLSKLVKTPNTNTANTTSNVTSGTTTTTPGINGLDNGQGKKLGIIRRLPDGYQAGVNPLVEKDQFYYHGDHLGSSNMITDAYGAVYQHLEYFPYGETWIEEGGSYGGNTPGYKFTGKELDPETGLYYYGARYYDPVLSRWISTDPVLEKYISGEINGGIYQPANLFLFTYSYNRPVVMADPTGTWPAFWDDRSAGEKAFAKHHPWVAIQLGQYKQGSTNISTVATTFAFMGASPKTGSILSPEDRAKGTGGQNAMRHVLMQAFLTSEYDATIAKEAGDAHENNTRINMKKMIFSSYDAADMAVDYRNNKIGRLIGAENKGKSRLDITKAAVERFRKTGFWIAYKTEKGYELRQTRLGLGRYETYKKALENKDERAIWINKDDK